MRRASYVNQARVHNGYHYPRAIATADSATYLRDPRVSPFRDVFVNYAPLFYLTVRAGQLGYRTCEIPVSRSYPDRGKVPTKIAGLRGRLAMMRELLDVVRGRYHPD